MGTKSLCISVDEEQVDAPNQDGVQIWQWFFAHQKELCSLKKKTEHYVKTSNKSRNICNGPLKPVTSTHICNSCCLAPVTYTRARTTSGLASTTLKDRYGEPERGEWMGVDKNTSRRR
jgi:hypothetical protein